MGMRVLTCVVMCVLAAVVGTRDSAAQGVQSSGQQTASRAQPPVAGRAVSGTVVDAQGGGIRDAKVTLRSADASWRAQQTTAEGGRYRFADVAAGPLVLEVEAAGFRPYTQTVEPDAD